MKKIQIACLIIVGHLVTGCATAPPVFEPLKTCGEKIVTVANAERVANDLENGNEADLLVFAAEQGWPFVSCLVSWYEQNGTAPQKAGAVRFKVGHVEARGPEACVAPAAPSSAWSIGEPNCPPGSLIGNIGGKIGCMDQTGKFLGPLVNHYYPAFEYGKPSIDDSIVFIDASVGCPEGMHSNGMMYTSDPPKLKRIPVLTGDVSATAPRFHGGR